MAVCRRQRAASDRPARARHPDPFLVRPTVEIATPAVFREERGQALEEMAQLAWIGFAE